MTRLGRISPRGRFDLAEAFRFLGSAPTHRELGIVADLLRRSGVEVAFDEELCALAEATGSSPFTALDLHVAVAHGIEALWAGRTDVRAG
jgi:hypothetical protein